MVKKIIWRRWKEFMLEQKKFIMKATLSIVFGVSV
jgi:hypothetical protein